MSVVTDYVLPTDPRWPRRPLLDLAGARDRSMYYNPYGGWNFEWLVADLEEQVRLLVQEAHDIGFRRGMREAHLNEGIDE